ncbi:MAG TPA: right-handed parallel beta-helix repeat-containing protein [Candidatus Binatia bacterium]|nr:right-handed parallel beta-helix repeat-containing protein [Candidatus Binatia bacterium]
MKNKKLAALSVSALMAVSLGLAGGSTALATTTCTFTTAGTTRTLDSDCTTDETITIPDGFTLEGGGHTITATDPPGGHFQGAVVANGGATANVRNLTITTAALANVCDDGAARLRGILFDGAGGSITDNTVRDINQGASGCQEGNAIEVRNAPFDTTGADKLVTIQGNVISNYQKTGIVANGSVAAVITQNDITGVGPVDYIGQNGIQIGFGATAIVRENLATGNDYTPTSFVSCGILLFKADGVQVSENFLAHNERPLGNFGRGGGQFKPNE